jgi:hypothetical protein
VVGDTAECITNGTTATRRPRKEAHAEGRNEEGLEENCLTPYIWYLAGTDRAQENTTSCEREGKLAMTVETLLQEARALPQEEQLRLASLLIQQTQSVSPSVETRREVLRQVRGMFRGMPGTGEFQAEKRRELEEELRREAVKQAKGSMARLLPSTKEFLAEKHAEREEN